MHAIRVSAPAKVNLFLGVGAVLEDGYHAVNTVMHALEFGDVVEITPSDSLELTCEPDVGVPPEKNLAWRAAELMAEAFGRAAAVRIRIEKRTPHGAGLGGGSSDAAAVIVGLAHLWGVDARDARCLAAARTLGADVAFFIGETGCALLTGRGDVLVAELAGVDVPVALVRPPAPVPTVAAYRAFDADPVPPGDPAAVIAAIEARDVAAVAASLSNNLTAAAESVVPEVADALEYLQGSDGVLGAAVSGSGSAVFALCDSPESADAIAQGAAVHGWWGMATMLAPAGASVTIDRERP